MCKRVAVIGSTVPVMSYVVGVDTVAGMIHMHV